jgi:hypothetical protein
MDGSNEKRANFGKVEKMAKKASVKISWEPFTITDHIYPAGSKKAGQTTKRVKFTDRTIESVMLAFGGSKDSLLKFLESKLSAVYVAAQADPDAAFRVPAKRLLECGYFKNKGLEMADPKEGPSKAEIKAAIALLKANA